MGKLQDITEILTEKGLEALRAGRVVNLGTDDAPMLLKAGTVLKMKQQLSGKETHLKLKRLDRKRGKLWAEEITLLKDEEAQAVLDKAGMNRFQRRWMAKHNKGK
jgi:hypothetical protein